MTIKEQEIRKNFRVGKNDAIEYSVYCNPCSGSEGSGDFSGVRLLKDGKVLFYLCDVAGHGDRVADEAGLYSKLINYTADHKNGFRSKDIVDVLENFYLTMIKNVDSDFPYMTAFFAVYDPETRKLDYSNAAHPAVTYFPDRNEPKKNEALYKTGGYIGGFYSEVKEKSISIDNPSENLFLLHTDGITERLNIFKPSKFYKNRLVETAQNNMHLPNQDLVERIYTDCYEYAKIPDSNERITEFHKTDDASRENRLTPFKKHALDDDLMAFMDDHSLMAVTLK